MSHDHDQTPSQRLMRTWLELGREIHGAIEQMVHAEGADGVTPVVALKEVPMMTRDGMRSCYLLVSFDSTLPALLEELIKSAERKEGGT